MPKFFGLTISRKIALLIVLALLTCGAVFAMALQGLKRVNAGVDNIASTTLPAVLAAADTRVLYLSLHGAAYDRIGEADPEKAKAITKRMEGLGEDIIRQINLYSQKTTDPEEKKVLDDAKSSMGAYMAKMQQVANLAGEGEAQMAMTVMATQVAPLHKRLTEAFDKLMKMRTAEAGAVSSAANATFKTTQGVAIAAALLGLAVIALAGFFIGRSITRPLARMEEAISRTARDLDFTVAVPVASHDEIGRTLSAYNGLLARLRDSFGEIQRATHKLANSTQEMNSLSQQIADNSHQQSDASSGLAAAVEQMTVSISVISNQAQDASRHTLASRATADSSAEVIMATVERIRMISESVQVAAKRIGTLRNDSDSISSVANIIRDIADQTNLLALNAAIEAARAGEQGRGFAVVADEVRKLAERTAKSTQEISVLLAKMQESAKQAVDGMDSTIREVDAGVENARRAGESIEQIRDAASAVVGVVEEISQAVREQSSASTIIAQQIEQIAQMTERNSAAASDSAQAVSLVSQMSHDITQSVAAYKV